MPGASPCPKCGAPLPSEGWAGLCPKCLVRVSLDAGGESGTPEKPLRRFGDYELLEEIARGGMGVVYKARQVSLNRTVAVKMILAGQLAGAAEVQRFRAEAEAAANLNHPNIVAIHEIGLQDGQHFFSMDYVQGQNLAEFVGQKPLPAKEAAKYLKSIAEAIQYAHERGILHRDLKPSNILIDQSGQPRITDFGLAKRMKGDSDLTISGQVLGSPNFMPPEQAAGKRAQIGPHSDIYALGAILFFLLTSRPPFAAESMTQTLQLVVTTEPPSPRLLNPGVPRDLETICLKCLSKEPTARYPSGQTLAQDLDRFLNGEPVRARPVGPTGKAWRWCQRNPKLASLAGVSVLLLLAVAIGSPIAALRINRERNQARQNLLRQYVANGNRLVEERDPLSALPWFAKALREEQGDPTRAEIHRLRLGTTAQQSPCLVQAWFHTDIVRDAALSPDGRWVLIAGGDGAARVWDVVTGKPVSAPMVQDGRIDNVMFSPDGQKVAITAQGGGTGLWEARTGRLLMPLLRGGAAVRFSPDGRRILIVGAEKAHLFDASTGRQIGDAIAAKGAFWGTFSPDGTRVVTVSGSSGTARVWDAATGKPVTDTISYIQIGNSPDFFGADRTRYVSEFSPDSRRLVLACGNSTARVCDAATGKDIVVVRHRGTVRHACFSPDGRWLATASHDSTAQVWDATTGAAISPPLRHKGPVMDVSFSPDGRLVVTASTDGTARVWDAASGAQIGGALQHASAAVFASFSADGERVLTVSNDQGVRIWEWRGAGEAYRVVKHMAPVDAVAVSPDGRFAVTVSVDGTSLVWEVATGQPLTSVNTNLAAIRRVQFAPDSRLLAFGLTNGTVRVWDLATGQSILSILAHRGLINHLEFSSDGKWLVTSGSDRLARVWEIPSGRLVNEMRHRESVSYASFTSDSEQIVTVTLSVPEAFQSGEKRTFDPLERMAITADWGQAQLWNRATGRPLAAAVKLGMFVSYVSFNPERRRVLATCSARGLTEKEAWIVDVLTGRRLAGPLQHDKGLIHGSLSPDGRWAVTTSWDHTARVWDAATGQPVCPRLRHQTYVYYAVFSPDARLVATASADHTARVWDAATGEPVTPPLRHSAAVNRVFFGPDTQWLVTATSDGEVRVWNLPRTRLAVADEVEFAQLLAAHCIDTTDSVLPLTAEAMQSAWAKRSALRTPDEVIRQSTARAPQGLLPGVERDYYVPGEDTEAALSWFFDPHQDQLREVQQQVNPDLPYPSALSSSLSNRLAGFLQVCNKAIEADPDPQHGGPYEVRTYVYERLGQYKNAIADMRECLWRYGPIPTRHFLVKQFFTLGRCYWYLGKREKAETYLQRAQECSSEDADSCAFLARSYATGLSGLCSVEKALPFALRAVASSKTNLSCSATLSEVYVRLGQPQKAADILEKALELHPNSGAQGALVCNHLAWKYATGPKEMRSPEKALPLALKAVELDKDGQATLNTLGVVYYRLGQFSNAVAVFERDSKNTDPLAIAYDQLFEAMSYRRLGEVAKAEACYAKGTRWLDENPSREDAELKEFRAEAEGILGKR